MTPEEKIDLIRRKPAIQYRSLAEMERELEIEDDLRLAEVDHRYRELLFILLDVAGSDLPAELRDEWLTHITRTIYLTGLMNGTMGDVPG